MRRTDSASTIYDGGTHIVITNGKDYELLKELKDLLEVIDVKGTYGDATGASMESSEEVRRNEG